jgi:hypothetical protein
LIFEHDAVDNKETLIDHLPLPLVAIGQNNDLISSLGNVPLDLRLDHEILSANVPSHHT